MVEAMGKSDEVADMSLEMCNDNGGQPYIYIVRNGKKITGGKNWQEEMAVKMAGRKMAGRNARKKNGSFNTYTVNRRNMTLISMLRYICVPKMAQLIHIVNLMIASAVTMEYQHRLTGWLGQSSL